MIIFFVPLRGRRTETGRKTVIYSFRGGRKILLLLRKTLTTFSLIVSLFSESQEFFFFGGGQEADALPIQPKVHEGAPFCLAFWKSIPIKLTTETTSCVFFFWSHVVAPRSRGVPMGTYVVCVPRRAFAIRWNTHIGKYPKDFLSSFFLITTMYAYRLY